MEKAQYENAEAILPRKSSLYLFSDGIFEVRCEDQHILGLPAFVQILKNSAATSPSGNLARIIESIRSVCGRKQFDDDVSLVGFYFDT
jgi:sigma-B regulation protein RsbU (phosphoserine phosphatase)